MTDNLTCRHCGDEIEEYDLAYLNIDGPRYVHASKRNMGWFGCYPSFVRDRYAEPLVSPYLFGDQGERLALATKAARLAIWYPILRACRRILALGQH